MVERGMDRWRHVDGLERRLERSFAPDIYLPLG